MLNHIDQLWLRSFHCVYENQSFKRAAEFLNLPTSNVSRHIALLEEKLATRLFDRTTRRIAATDAGEQLYARTHALLARLDEALEEVTQHSHEVMGQLKILMPDSPALAQAVVAFCRKHPSIGLCCDTSLSPKEDLLDGFDVVLSFQRGSLADSNWIATEIKRWPSVVVASPERLQAHPLPYHITDLQHLPCISSLTALNGTPWIFKTAQGGLVTQRVHSSFRVNSGNLAKSAALAGLGFAILPIDFCQEEIKAGHLETVALEYQPDDLVLYAFYASRKHVARKIPMFIDHLRRQANEEMSV
ncbi:LysR family transcriptional regulator [Vibrio navarrensis]|uniref:LysR family transcriptional regulator n=1 Tax=Vibrio navarrensis TaxID=29495 RepID=UPI0018DC5121|nr:LysR family transcriptional regulator [Vibrio navarrensis]MBH9738386.1 LysR family transcriptional regulator [Vibrio navarrensis]